MGLEDALSAAFNSSPNDITPNYRQHFRDIRFNLEKNRQLLGDWLFGELESKKLASMTAEEMMSDDVRKEVKACSIVEPQRETIKEEMFEAYQTDWYKTHMMNKLSGGFKVMRSMGFFCAVPTMRIR